MALFVPQSVLLTPIGGVQMGKFKNALSAFESTLLTSTRSICVDEFGKYQIGWEPARTC